MSAATVRLATGAVVVVAALLALRAGSLLPVRNWEGDRAWVRLSWSARPERIERCRRRSDSELAELPEHMRLRLECAGGFARYILQLTVDGEVARRDTVRGGGFRNDRPMHVLEESSLQVGERHVVVSLSRVDSATTPFAEDGTLASRPQASPTDREARERDERMRRSEESIAPHLSLDTTVTLRAGDVLLITYDGVRRALRARTGSE